MPSAVKLLRLEVGDVPADHRRHDTPIWLLRAIIISLVALSNLMFGARAYGPSLPATRPGEESLTLFGQAQAVAAADPIIRGRPFPVPMAIGTMACGRPGRFPARNALAVIRGVMHLGPPIQCVH